MPVIYNSNLITPAPFISISKQYTTLPDGQIVGKIYHLVVRGKTLAWMGSPNSSKQWDTTGVGLADENIPASSRLGALLRKQEALRALFSQEGLLFEIQPLDGTKSISCNPRIKSLEFSDGPWFNYFDWVLTLEADVLNGLGAEEDVALDTYKIQSATNDWVLEPTDELGRVWKLSHNVSAVGKRFYDTNGSLTKPAWQNARDYVLGAVGLGLDSSRLLSSGVVNGDGLTAYNYLRSEHTNELAGSHAVSENWLAFDLTNQPDSVNTTVPAIEDFTVSTRISAQEGNLTRVTVEGTIRGLEQRDNTTHALIKSRFANAQAKWAAIHPYLYMRATGLAGALLNQQYLDFTSGQNEINGTINYQVTYDNRANNLVPGALTETITTTVEGASDVFAALPVPGRLLGPVLQSLNTVTANSITVNIEAVLQATVQGYNAVEPDTDAIVLSFAPFGSFLSSDVATWSPRTGRYQRQTKYTYE